MTQHELHPSLKTIRSRVRPVLERVRIRAVATAPLLEVTAEQHYVNKSRRTLEIVYTFPVPARAVLLGLEFELGDRTLGGVVRARSEASAAYDRAIEDGDSAVLVEMQVNGLYTANLGNLLAGERAVIRIRYGQLLEAQGEDWRIAIPTALAPFYGDPEADGGLDPRAAPTQSLAAEYPLEFTLELPHTADAGALRCTSHHAEVKMADGVVVARLPDDARLDRDVVFLARREPLGAAIAGRDGDRAVVVASTVLGHEDVAERPASVRLVLDCSGSMAGDSMDWAAVGCQRLVEGLREGDEFSITRFGSSVDQWTPRLLKATTDNRARFGRRLLEVVADLGGTQMEAALKAAVALHGTHERSEVVLLTDGEIWASEALVRWARGEGVRVFVIGVGAAPNQPFLSQLANETGGSCEFVSPGEDMIAAVERVLARVREPRREALAPDWPARPDWSLQLPAVAHAGQTVHLIAGFEAAPIGALEVAGRSIALPGRETKEDTLARVVAYQRLLSGDFRYPGKAAEQYQLVTEWTSLVAVLVRAPGEKAIGLPQIEKVDHMLAAGWGGLGSAPAVWRTRTAPATRSVASACSAPPPDQGWPGIPAFLKRAATGLRLEAHDPGVDEAELRTMQRRQALQRHTAELSGWIRAINRRIVVESLSGHAAAPTLHWLAGCVAAGVIDRLDCEVREVADERTLVCAFIRELGALSPDLDEGLSDRTLRWLDQHRRAGAGDERCAVAALRVLDAVLLSERRDTPSAVAAARVAG